jgi:hypothetical protein
MNLMNAFDLANKSVDLFKPSYTYRYGLAIVLSDVTKDLGAYSATCIKVLGGR